MQGKARLALKNWKNLIGDQREDNLTSLEVQWEQGNIIQGEGSESLKTAKETKGKTA